MRADALRSTANILYEDRQCLGIYSMFVIDPGASKWLTRVSLLSLRLPLSLSYDEISDLSDPSDRGFATEHFATDDHRMYERSENPRSIVSTKL